MKTAFPEHDRNRYCIIDATEYEEHYATYFERQVKQPPNDPVYISAEEKSVEQLTLSIGLATVEIFMGLRPMHHLSPWLSQACYRRVHQQVQKVHEMVNRTFKPPASSGPLQPRVHPVKARRIILQKVSPKAYEACLIVQDAQRARAVALRAEFLNRRWKITALDIA
ncbi:MULTISPECIES: Rv3235 family protein [Rothia]|uniref:Uncharacterized protein n=1 Tax=Rothia endophytica TaxID=1324766 RepID=A0ABP9BA28_9MICC|nr:Rv3235 family protein [Rothia sp. P100]MCM3509465.1 Rv3235 family protein [Rothia sp. P100]SLE46460.1 Uncharacterised protein [Mycobacteroides abscessus subsp. bolletii]